MKKLISIISILALALVVACSAYIAPRETAGVLAVFGILTVTVFIVANTSRLSRRSGLVAGTNTAPANWGTHAGGKITMLAAAAITTRYKLVKKGADAEHIAIPTATADEPIGVCMDEPAAAEDPVSVVMLGAHDRTIPMVAGGSLTDGAALYMGSTGSVVVRPTAAGVYWYVGDARGAWSTGEVCEVIPAKPEKLTLVAALTNASGDIADTPSAATNPIKTDFDSLLVAAGKLQADFLILSAALATNKTGVGVATT